VLYTWRGLMDDFGFGKIMVVKLVFERKYVF
jgi:hypothetical protein